MRVLFDHGTPRGLARALKGHEVTEARDRGWDKKTNGELIALAEQHSFDVLVTPDKNIRYQQNQTTRTIALVIIGNPQWPFCDIMSNASSPPLMRQSKEVIAKSGYPV